MATFTEYLEEGVITKPVVFIDTAAEVGRKLRNTFAIKSVGKKMKILRFDWGYPTLEAQAEGAVELAKEFGASRIYIWKSLFSYQVHQRVKQLISEQKLTSLRAYIIQEDLIGSGYAANRFDEMDMEKFFVGASMDMNNIKRFAAFKSHLYCIYDNFQEPINPDQVTEEIKESNDSFSSYLSKLGFKFDKSQTPPLGVIDYSATKVYTKGKYTISLSQDSTGRYRWTYKIGGKVAKTGFMLNSLKDYFAEIGAPK